MTIESAGIKNEQRLKLFGATKSELDFVDSAGLKANRVRSINEEEEKDKLKSKTASRKVSRVPKGPYTFREFKPWEPELLQLDPTSKDALKFLHRLATDPGIIGVMEKHKWEVKVLSEMPPKGYVGISPSCILGYNVNQGDEISLRLRTDDFDGFRPYDKVRDTLIHELTHMVHTEHDNNFKALMSQLNKEAESFDWSRKTAHTLSGEVKRNWNWNHSDFDMGSSDEEGALPGSKGHRLGGKQPEALGVREAIAIATISRDSSARLGGSMAVGHVFGAEIMAPERDDAQVNEIEIGSGSAETVQTGVERCQEDSMADKANKEMQEDVEAVKLDEMLVHPAGSQSNEGMDDFLGGFEEDSEIMRVHSAASGVRKRIQSAVAATVQCMLSADRRLALETIVKMLRNIIDHPLEDKFKTIRKTNPTFMARVGRHQSAVDLLLAVGFSESRNEQGDEVYRLQGRDPGLLWLALSTLEEAMSPTLEN